MERSDPVGGVVGPLAPYEAGLRAELAQAGYAASSVADVVRAMARLSGWLQATGLTPGGLTPAWVEEFLAVRRQHSRVEAVARRGLGPVLRFLRGRGVVPGGDLAVEVTPVEALLADYRAWLVGERGLAAASVRCYLIQSRTFLAQLPDPLDVALTRLDAASVTAFMVRACGAASSVWSAKALVTSIRSLLRFLQVDGRIPGPLTAAVPGVAGWRLSALPRALGDGQAASMLASCDTTTTTGRRDHAVLLVLARLGLRGAEVAALTLDDVDWRAGELAVRGKGARIERLPLPGEVGVARAGYVTGGRPRCACRALFVTTRAPHQQLSPAAVRQVVARACGRAGLPRLGAHRLRHTLATGLLRAGAPLAEVGQVLRHRSQLSTAVYAKVDHDALRALARPWPEPECAR
jgi:site-specific recombinase XerD